MAGVFCYRLDQVALLLVRSNFVTVRGGKRNLEFKKKHVLCLPSNAPFSFRNNLFMEVR